MDVDKSNKLLGELLTEAGLMQIDDLREAANIARSQNLLIGKVLVMSGYISKELLEATVEAQSRFKDNHLDYALGLKALKIVSARNCGLDEALLELGHSPRIGDGTSNRLGTLLLDASLVTKNEFDTALEESKRCGLPLGRVLANLTVVPEFLVNCALKVQKMLRSGEISKEEAIRSLIESKEGQVDQPILAANDTNAAGQNVDPSNQVETSPIPVFHQDRVSEFTEKKGNFPDLNTLSLHHILRIAGLIQTEALEAAIKESLENPEVMAIILKRSGLLEEFVIEAARECCQLIASGQVKPEQAIIALHQCQRTRSSIKDCLEEFGWLQKSEIIS